MHKDIQLFSELCDFLLEEERKNPVPQPIPTSTLFQKLDLSLNNEGQINEELIENLKAIIKHTP